MTEHMKPQSFVEIAPWQPCRTNAGDNPNQGDDPAVAKVCAAEIPPNWVMPPGYTLVFEDTFRTSNLDTTQWWTRGAFNNGYQDYMNDEWQRYRESGNHVQGDTGIGLTSLPHNGEFWPSGFIRTKDLFDLASGLPYFFECRGRVPGGIGTWPAFWLAASEREAGVDSSTPWPPEIDIMEICNNGVEDTTWMLGARCQQKNWDTCPQKYQVTAWADAVNPDWGTWWAPFNFADDYHRFQLHYQRPNFAIYCDDLFIIGGIYDWTDDGGNPAPPANILCNLAIGGSWAGRYGVDDSAMPQAFQMDYVRVWQQLKQSTIGHDLMPR